MNLTLKMSLAAFACLVCVGANAQEKKYPEQERMRPGMSEYWTPQPKVVTPGDIKTNTAPSDAIVLFDGKDLSAWEGANGVFLKTLQVLAKAVVIAVCSCRICTKFRFWTAITTKHT